jgi:nitrogen fixation protein FixH
MNGDVSNPARTGRQFTGKHMFALMSLFFGVVIAVNITMAWFAEHSWTGLVVQNSYVASQEFNQMLEAAREQKARGWHTAMAYEENRLSLQIVDNTGKPVYLDRLTAVIGRPAEDRADHEVGFVHAGGGLWMAQTELGHGIWQIRINGQKGDEPFRLDARMVVSSDRKGRLE